MKKVIKWSFESFQQKTERQGKGGRENEKRVFLCSSKFFDEPKTMVEMHETIFIAQERETIAIDTLNISAFGAKDHRNKNGSPT